MDLRIITPTSSVVHSVAWVELATTRGSFVVQEGHAPMLLVLQPDAPVLFLLNNGKVESVVVSKGLAQIERTAVTLVMNAR